MEKMDAHAESLPIPIPKAKAESAGVQLTSGERAEFGRNWQATIVLVFDQNEPIIAGAVDPGIVALDETCAQMEPVKRDEWVEQTVGERKEKRTKVLEESQIIEDLKARNNGQEPQPADIQTEKERRQILQNTSDTLYAVQALKLRIEQAIKEEEAKIRKDKGRDPTTDEKREIREKTITKYWDGDDTYYQYDGSGARTEMHYIATYKPICDGLQDLAETAIVDGQPIPREVQQAKELSKSFTLSQDGTSFLLPVVEKRTKELEARSIELMEVVTDVFDTAMMPYGETIPKKRNEKTKKDEIDFEALEKVFPSGRFGRMAILFTTYHELDPVKNIEQRNTLAALLLQELRGVKIEPGSNLSGRINSLSANWKILDSQLDGLTAAMKGLVADALQVDPETIPLEERYVLRDLLIAYGCKAHVGLDAEGRIAFDNEAKKLIGKFVGGDRIHKDEEAYLAALSVSGEKIGTLLIDALGLDAQRLKGSPESTANYYAQQLVTRIQDRRRILNDPNKPKLNPHQEGNYQHMSEEMIKYEALKFMEKNPLGNWLKMLGMLALILGPGFSKFLDEGMVSGGGERPQE